MAQPNTLDFVQQCLNEGLAIHEIVERAQAAGKCAAVCGDLMIVSSTLDQVTIAMNVALRRPENAAHRQHTMRVFGPEPSKA
jgi:hypothetical protein